MKIALIETSAGFNQLFKTADAGKSWTLMSDPADNYTRLYAYQDNGYGAKVAAVGKNGLVQRVIMEDGTPFGIIDLNSPNTLTDFTSVWSADIGGNIWIVVAASNGTLYTTTDANATTVTWLSHSAPSLASNNAKVIEADRTTAGGNPAISGTILTNNGSILALFKPQNASLFNVTVFTSPTGVNVADIALDEPNNRVLVFDNTGKQVYRVDLNNTAASTTATLIPQTNTIAQANGFAYRNTRVILTGNSGEIFTGILDGTASNIAWTDNTNNTTPLPLQDIQYSGTSGTIYAAGTDGTVLQRQTGGNWKTLSTSITKNINRIYFASTSSGIVAGDNGLLNLFAVSGATLTNGALPVTNGPVNENLHDVIVSGVTTYVAGENGTVLYSPDAVNTPFAITNQSTTNDFYGLAFKPSSTQAYAIGENSKIHWCIGASRTVVKNVFTPTLKDVHFADVNHGTLAGDNYTLRQTHDGGVTWEVILPNNTTVGKVVNRVWTVNGNYALTIGDGKYMGVIENNIATTQSASLFPGAGNNFLSIAFNPDKPLQGFIAGNQRRMRGITLTPSGSSFILTINNTIAQPVFTAPAIPAGTEIRALHVFDNNSVMAVGNNNFIGYYNTTAWVDLRNNSLPSTTVHNDVYFHDHYNGYSVGNSGIMLKSINTSLNPTTGFIIGTTWTQKSIVDGFNITANSQANITAIAFASRYNGVWGGTFNITNTTNKPYVRLIRDESELFSTYFWYDKLGRIVVSQNTKQFNGNTYGYFIYDEIGRVVETGAKSENTSVLKFSSVFGSMVANYYNPKVIDDAKLVLWVHDATGVRREVTKSYYDKSILTELPISFIPESTTLRSRMVHTTYEELFDNNDTTYDHGTHYEYNIDGTIKTILQDNKKMADEVPSIANQRFKSIDYSFDLISRKISQINYQSGEYDQWSHTYVYDADNRITQVKTSNNSIFWNTDAIYKYYFHGPLARTELGENQVQGSDYVYNLQGWAKGVNSNVLMENNDPGKDGGGFSSSGVNAYFARDVYGYSLNYFANDYKSIDPFNHGSNSFTANISGSDVEANRYDLFNGNISSMITTITNPVTREILPLGNAYQYDQLNRLKQSVSYINLDINPANGTFNEFGSGGSQMYFNALSYDANGNILTQSRKDHQNNPIDNLQYRYAKDANGKTIQNRLYHVNDDIDYDNSDIDDQLTIHGNGVFIDNLDLINLENNYSYTEIGELKRNLQEGITEIVWRLDGKIKEIVRNTSDIGYNLKFDYDAFGNRVAKHIISSDGMFVIQSTYYVTDIDGKVFTSYIHKYDDSLNLESFAIDQQYIYGSKRIGVKSGKNKSTSTSNLSSNEFKNEMDLKNYELINHLGNVLTVISDRKIPVDYNSDLGVDFFVAEIKTATDYYGFGCVLKGRDFNSSNYNFGFQGQITDNELQGNGNSITYTHRILDPRIGRFFSVDNLSSKYPWNSTYAFSANRVIDAIEIEGLEFRIIVTTYPDYTVVINVEKDDKIMFGYYEYQTVRVGATRYGPDIQTRLIPFPKPKTIHGFVMFNNATFNISNSEKVFDQTTLVSYIDNSIKENAQNFDVPKSNPKSTEGQGVITKYIQGEKFVITATSNDQYYFENVKVVPSETIITIRAEDISSQYIGTLAQTYRDRGYTVNLEVKDPEKTGDLMIDDPNNPNGIDVYVEANYDGPIKIIRGKTEIQSVEHSGSGTVVEKDN